MTEYLPVLLLIAAAASFGLVNLILSWALRPARYDPVKMAPYECGIETLDDPRARYSVHYYVIAVLFVVFDVETIFLFPWAVMFNRLGVFGLVEMLIFIAILVIGYFYVWKRKALDWA